MKSESRWKGLIEISLGFVVAIFVTLLFKLTPSQIFLQFEEKTLDWRFEKKIQKKWVERQNARIDDIIIIDIDNRSLEKLGRFDQWPRNYHAQLIKIINAGHPAAIGFDVLFMELDQQDPASDDSLVQAVKAAGNVFLAMSFSEANPDNFIYPMQKPPAGLDYSRFSIQIDSTAQKKFPSINRFDGKFIDLYNASAGFGFANFFAKVHAERSVIRDMPLFVNFCRRQYPSLAMAIMMGTTGITTENLYFNDDQQLQLQVLCPDSQMAQIEIPVDKYGHLLIDYQGAHRTFRYVSYYDVLKNRVPNSIFRGKIVLIGATAAGLYEWRPVPFQAAFPGVEIHANLIYTIMHQSFIRKTGTFFTIFFLCCLAMLVAFSASRLRLCYSLPFVIVLVIGYVFFAHFIFIFGNIWIDIVAPVITIFLAYLSVVSYRYVTVEKDKRIIKNMFGHYLSPDVVNELLKNQEELALGGKRMEATIFFSDVKDFTSVAEKMEPEELVTFLNEYLSAMTEIILKYNGYLDKYEGDAIMAIFGVPLPLEYHAKNACLAALEMQEKLAQLRVKWELERRPQLEMRIGLHTGPLVVGNIGGENRFDYTVMGDSVNLASRLEGANKIYGTSILISEDIYELVEDDVIVRELDFIQVKGKKQPVRVYELLERSDNENDDTTLHVLENFAKGLSIYRRGNWELAYNQFQQALHYNPNDGPALEFFERCKCFIEQKRYVASDWDGVFEAKTK